MRCLNYWLEQRDMSRAELARRLGYKTQSAISQWDRGNSPDFTTITKISEVLDIPLRALFDDPLDDRKVGRVPAPNPEEEEARARAEALGFTVLRPRRPRRPRPKK